MNHWTAQLTGQPVPNFCQPVEAPPEPPSNPWGLSPRQEDAIKCLMDGSSNKSAAEAMGISCKTYEVHLWNAYGRMKVKNRIQAVLAWAEWKGNQ